MPYIYHVHHFTFVLSPPPFHPFLPSSLPFSPFSFFPPPRPPLPSFFPRFQALVEIEGSGGGLLQLLECFPCTSNQQLVNRMCIDTDAPTNESIGMSMWVRYKCLNLEMMGKNMHCLNLCKSLNLEMMGNIR